MADDPPFDPFAPPPPPVAAAAAPQQGPASVTFLVGEKDKFLTLAKVWVDAIDAAVKKTKEPGVFVQVMSSDQTKLAANVTALAAQAATGKLTTATLDAHLGGLRNHTLVFVTHGLDGTNADTGGLLIFKGAKSRHEMMLAHLDFLEVDDKGKIVMKTKKVEGPDGKPKIVPVIDVKGKTAEGVEFSNQELFDTVMACAVVLQAIRDATIWDRICLACCGSSSHDPTSKPKLPSFAIRLKELTRKQVFFNLSPIWLPTIAKPFAYVGKDGDENNPESGRAFFDQTKSVVLKTKPDTFFEAFQQRTDPVPPPAPPPVPTP